MSKAAISARIVDLPPPFEPWLGSGYGLGNHADLNLVHVMGESHYNRPDDPKAYKTHAGLTREIVRDWAFTRSAGGAFFTRVAAMVTGQSPQELDREAAWSSFAYSVFV